MPGQLGPNWNGWARLSASYSEAVKEVLNKRIRKKPAKKRPNRKKRTKP